MTELAAISSRRVKLTAKKQLKEHFKNEIKATWPVILMQMVQNLLLLLTIGLAVFGYRLAVDQSTGDWYLLRTFFSALALLFTWSAKWAIIDTFQKPDVTIGWSKALQGFRPQQVLTSFLLAFVQKILLFFWSLLLFPVFIKVVSYSQTYYAYKMDLLFKKQQRSLTDYITISKRVMNGRKRELFLLELSFVGWHCLTIVTGGLACFWVTPYLNVCRVVYSTQVFAHAIEETK
ncbi:DUF975 family protein [Fructobacillus fructosus]|uniref:DUF975 family protein n=1 Tax=Fructobacillus fructosus TaxID=1631 RepID=UPI004034C2BB